MTLALDSKLGTAIILNGQLNFTDQAGVGLINRVQVPQQQPSNSSQVFVIESATLLITDNNGNGTLAAPYPESTVFGSPTCMGFVVPVTALSNPNELDGSTGGAGPVFTIQSLGPGVLFTQLFEDAGAGTSRSMWVLSSPRRIIVPQNYVFGVYVTSPDDGSPHVIQANLLVSARYLENEC